MKRGHITNLLLLLLIIGLYFFVNYQPTPEKTQTGLSELTQQDIHTINIKRQNRSDIEIKKVDQNWQIIQPIQAKANDTRIKLILSLLSQPLHSQFEPTATTDLEEFELGPDSINLQLNQLMVKFGGIETLSRQRYIQSNNKIYLIADNIAPLLNSTVASFIDNRLIANSLKIKQLQLPTQSLELKNGHWQSDRSLSSDQLVTLIDAWQHAYAMQVLPISSDEINSLENKKVHISFEGEDNTMSLIVQTTERSVILINTDTKLAFHFPISTQSQLFPPAEPN